MNNSTISKSSASSTYRAEMEAFDRLPQELKHFARTANHQWACVPMLERATKGRNIPKLLNAYVIQDRQP